MFTMLLSGANKLLRFVKSFPFIRSVTWLCNLWH